MEKEKIMKALKLCASGCNDDGCAYWEETNLNKDIRCVDLMARDALDLIDEMEERIAIMEEGRNEDDRR